MKVNLSGAGGIIRPLRHQGIEMETCCLNVRFGRCSFKEGCIGYGW